MRLVIYLLLPLLLLAACEGEREYPDCSNAPDVSEVEVDLDFMPLDAAMLQISDTAEFAALLREHPYIGLYFSSLPPGTPPAVRAREMMQMIKHPVYDSIVQDVQRTYGDYGTLRAELTAAFRNLKYYYPDFKTPKVRTVLSGLHNGLFVSDSLVVISTDYFLGPEATHQPVTYDYIKDRLVPEHVVPTIMRNLSNYFNPTMRGDQSMLGEMIDFGKAYYFTKAMIPCHEDRLVIQYTAEQMKDVYDNEKIIWTSLVQNETLFETDMLLKKKFLQERPNVPEIGEKCPGRIGTWVGWEIVRNYMLNHPEMTLQELMQKTNALEIFNESRYKPI